MKRCADLLMLRRESRAGFLRASDVASSEAAEVSAVLFDIIEVCELCLLD